MGIWFYLLFRWGFKYSTFSFESVSWETESLLWDKRDKGAEKGTFDGPSVLAKPQTHNGFLSTSDQGVIWTMWGAGCGRSEGGCDGVGWRYVPGLPPWMSRTRFSTCLCRCKSRVLHQHQKSCSKPAPGKLGMLVFKLKKTSWYSFALINSVLLLSTGPTSPPITFFFFPLELVVIYICMTIAQNSGLL